jgi:hypothetical protein
MQVRQYLEPRAGAGAAVPFEPDEHEAVQKYLIKRVLEVCPSTPDLVIYLYRPSLYREVARLPLAFFRLQIIVRYWSTLCGMAIDRLLSKRLLENVALALRQKPSWCLSLQSIFGTFRVCCTKRTTFIWHRLCSCTAKQIYRECHGIFN